MPNGKTSCFVDTSVIVYSVDPKEPKKQAIAVNLLRTMVRNHTLVLSPQSLNESYRVITDKRLLLPRGPARDFIADLSPACTAPLDYAVTQHAWLIQDQTNFAIWDCLLLASASLSGCEFFLSEDLQHERQILNLRILNPFALDQLTDLPF